MPDREKFKGSHLGDVCRENRMMCRNVVFVKLVRIVIMMKQTEDEERSPSDGNEDS
jgi:hypothetical protein